MKRFLFHCSPGLMAGVVMATAGTAAAALFHVAPGGDNTNPGTTQEPLATLEAARDNGLTIEAATGKEATLYGGRRVTNWKRDGATLWAAELPGVKEGTWDFRALVVDGRLAERACYPATNTFDNLGTWSLPLLPAVAGHWERKPTHEELTTMPYDPKDIPATLDVRNAEVRMYHMWAESLVGVTTNDTQRSALILSSEPDWPPGAVNRRKYVIYNTREGMTRPGQWYLSTAPPDASSIGRGPASTWRRSRSSRPPRSESSAWLASATSRFSASPSAA